MQRFKRTKTSHPFNSSHLRHNVDGSIQAWLITDQGESVAEDDMNRYNWGDRINEWRSDAIGRIWKRAAKLTSQANRHSQNIQSVTSERGETVDGMLFYYGRKPDGKEGTGYLWLPNDFPSLIPATAN